jgi:hypothetical protein
MIEASLVHDGRFWIAWNDSWTVREETLEELDRAVARVVRDVEGPGVGRQVTVRMTFDRSVIPEWIRQYSQHYFNRLVTVEVPPRSSAELTAEGEGACQPT